MTDSSPLRARGGLIDALSSTVDRGGHGLKHTPPLLRRVLEEGAWQEFETVRGEVVQHTDFLGFVTTPPLKGLGATVDLVRRMVADDPVALDLLDRAVGGEKAPGDPVSHSEATPTQTAALRRLQKDAPELHARVLAGELSAHAAMVQGGFRARTISVPVSKPESAARALRKNLKPEELAHLIKLLSEEEPAE
ncbi:hypothetical protein [Streptomyces stelliscabiei]|uniref:hypothetical protein n=1 Tax=Streptomyces stelliscabiei TaxID=146820 RepID=UPI0029B533E3|nr:hypothetical protein [Streptomyces stelliscabiei]MDX2557647.1 hypothetical protein [Streptomyces stelliscabiei]MDX2617100.1 hypothetical protein [Streptomyces stelliscabiei]MDX2641474.1 hypothetical protein [Streptomyces stelliscabiei]MDX2666476.1 hypothetical protein [Streptomyces stelliscabiei]MDX2717327.1 hypothetical protein [Streptomyces stelliscabiei]